MTKLTIENGSFNIRVGFSSTETPYSVMHSKGIEMPIKKIMNTDKKYFCGEATDFLGHDHRI